MIRLTALIFLLIVMAGCSSAGVPWRPDELQWWWSNQDPPEVTLSGPARAVRASTSIQVTLRPADRASLVSASLDGSEIPAQTPLQLDTSIMSDGLHTISVMAEDRSRRRNRSEASITIQSDNTPPSLTWDIQPNTLTQGSAAIIRLRSNEPTAVEASSDDRPLPLDLGNDYAWAIVSFSPDAPIGQKSLTFVGRDEAGNESRLSTTLSIGSGDFPSEDVEIPPALATLLQPEFRADEETMLAGIFAKSNEPPHWTGRFRVPTEGTILTEFATERAFNGGPTVGRHAGVDIAAPQGSAVLASQAGRVALIDPLTVRGNTLVIDHGHGIYTLYAHLSEILVSPDAQVEAGQQVARVGTTGLSTGPHLHWEVWVGGANVDPFNWTKLDLP